MPQILLPGGRLVGGSVEKLYPRTQADGKTSKLDAQGKPMMQVNFGVAIPKAGEQHWNQTDWGRQVWDIGAKAEPQMHMSPAFAWKVVDGDSQLPNKNGKIPSRQTGYAGNWIIWFSQGWAPKCVNADGTVTLPEGSIVPGYYVQVFANIESNGAKAPNTPGLYMNPEAVALVGIGEKIATDVDTTAVGFGKCALPAGAQTVPQAVVGFTPTAAAPVAPPVVTPNPAFMAVPSVPATPFAPPAPPAVPAHHMTAKANGATYEQMVALGWNDALLIQHGMMTA